MAHSRSHGTFLQRISKSNLVLTERIVLIFVPESFNQLSHLFSSLFVKPVFTFVQALFLFVQREGALEHEKEHPVRNLLIRRLRAKTVSEFPATALSVPS
jgi:hypothetical protein